MKTFTLAIGKQSIELSRLEAERTLAMLEYLDERSTEVAIVTKGKVLKCTPNEAIAARRALATALRRRGDLR